MYQSDLLVNHGGQLSDVEEYHNLSTHIDVCKSLKEIECVKAVNEELLKIKVFQSNIEIMYDSEPQDRQMIKNLLDETRKDLKINCECEFDAI